VEVEAALAAHPSVLMAAVVGLGQALPLHISYIMSVRMSQVMPLIGSSVLNTLC
jgi:acyl-coenzyme A synthetase/AMP-(fatty) acid ligase